MHSPLTRGLPVSHKNFPLPGEETLWLVIDSTQPGFKQFTRFSAFLENYWKVEEQLYMSMHIALSEAVTNAIEHGNKSDPGAQVYISASNDPDFYSMTIENEGEGFDFSNVPDPTEPGNLEKEHGRGIFLMKALADHVHYTKNGKSVKLVFFRKKEARN
jgi:serine/threonine-protein kinase RsbW